MKLNKKQIVTEESPLELTRRLRYEFFARFDHDLKKVCNFLMKEQEKHKDRLVDVELLRKKGIIKSPST